LTEDILGRGVTLDDLTSNRQQLTAAGWASLLVVVDIRVAAWSWIMMGSSQY
jgi:hypothetical protein